MTSRRDDNSRLSTSERHLSCDTEFPEKRLPYSSPSMESHSRHVRSNSRPARAMTWLDSSRLACLCLTLAFMCLVTPVTSQQDQQVPDPDNPLGASLAFVFDITGSMYDDLVQVIKGAAEILQDALTRREKPLYNYVLVPFHDPVVGPVLVTTNPDKFQRNLRDLYVQGGGDCPEMSIGAIKKALEVSLPYSFIYVFTDARSKDYYLTEEVLSLIQQKQSQVVFVLTGDCGNVTHSGYRAYEEIAATSSGQVFLLKKSQVNQVLNFVRVAVQARKVNLLAVNEDEGRTQVFNLPLDSHLKEVTVSISGENPKIALRDPEGNKKTLKNGLTQLLSLNNVHIVNVKDPMPGTWRLRVSSSGPHTVRVTGLSTADFASGFSKYPTEDFSQTRLRPIQGIPTHVLVNSTGIEYPSTLNDLELVDLRGNSLAKFPLVQNPKFNNLYNVTSFIPPEQFFYVKVTGTDDQGFVMQRTTPTAISPLKPRAPRVFMPEVTRGFFDQTAVITCQVFSLVPYTVQWYREGAQQGYDLFFTDPANVTLEIPRASSYSEGDYSCNVTNSAGFQSAITYLDISDPPPVIIPPQNVSVLPGETAILSCIAISAVPYNMTWRRETQYGPLTLDPRFRSYSNDSLTIYNVDRQDEGSYTCTASNEGGSTSETFHLRLQVSPVVQISPREQSFVAGSTRNFTCIAGGYPEPSFLWRQDGQVLPIGGRIQINGGYLVFQNLKPSDEGDYECVASNSAGEDSTRARLVYIEAPRVREFERKRLVAVGDQARLTCIADGIPAPNITWYRADRMLQSAYNVDITRNGQLIISNVQDSDAGDYRCVAQNEAGSDSVNLSLEVGSPPEIILPPDNIGIEIEGNGSLPCQAVGRPLPKLSWRRGDGRPLDVNGRFRQQPSGSLDIAYIQRGDEGIYTCVAQNPFGVADSSAYVSVTGIVRPLIAYTYPYVKVVEGETAELECIVLLGKPKPKLSWLRNGKILRASDRVRYLEPGRVALTDVREADDGEYVCLASNIGGNETYSVNLDVLVPPRLIRENDRDRQTNFSVVQGGSVSLPCDVTADPPPTFTWFKDGSPISLTDIRYYIRNDGALEIFSADIQDTAQYKCVASNVAGEVEKDVDLFVQVSPVIAGDLEETYEININESVLLPCEVSGIPRPSVSWSQNFMPITSMSSRVQQQNNGLYISRAQITDKAIYECEASNIAGTTNKIITLIVYIPPTLEEGPEEVTVLYGQSAILECESGGDPPPTVLWKKDGVILDTDNPEAGYYLSLRGSLTIDAAVLRDAGSYSCSATNPAGVVSREISLTVHGTPEIPGPYNEYNEIVERNPVILPCPAVGTPRPRVTWYKDDVQLTGNELGIVQLEDGSLEIDNIQARDSGVYECVAENVAGVANRIMEIKVLVPPKLTGIDGTGGPETPRVIIDNNVTLTCPVSEDTDPPPVITWYKDNQQLLPGDLDGRVVISDNGRFLTIVRAVVTDEARYKCLANNVAGEAERNYDLDVQVPPYVDEAGMSPFNQSVVTGQPLYVNCPIQGKPPPQVKWLKDGEPLSADLDPNVRLLAEGRRLELVNARVTDRGRYLCVGENIAGRTTRDFLVNIYVPPSVEQPGVIEQSEVVEGNTVYLTCPASGIPLPKITWFRNEVPIKANTSKVTLLESGWTLEIRDSNVSDATRYFCRAENLAGDTEKVFDLEVLLRPYINRENLDTDPEVVINNTAVINCPVSGNPVPDIIWYRNGVLLDATIHPRYEILAGGRQIRVYSAQVKDKGRYTCAANNRAGDDEVGFDLQVLVPPQIERSGQNLQPKVLINSSVVLSCPTSGVPRPDITWYKDGQPVELRPGVAETRAEGVDLVLNRAQVADTGRYMCVVQNPAGEDSLNYNLNVQIPPRINIDGIITDPAVIENESTVLECPAEGVPEPTILWFQDGIPLDAESNPRVDIDESGRRLVISPTKVEDAGLYVCLAANEAGEAEETYELEVWLPPMIDTTASEPRPRVIKGQTSIINCQVTGIPFPAITWTKDGLELQADPRVQVLSDGLQLRITNAAVSDTAVYTCVATNPAGVDKADYDLVVLVPPAIDESNVVYDRKVNEGRRVELECPVSGIPLPSVEWLVNGQPASEFDHVRLLNQNRILEIDNVRVEDTAFYTCVATNEAGQLERNFNLDVYIPPTIDRESLQSNLVVVQNKTLRFHCPASGIPDPDIMWMKDEYPFLDFPYPHLRRLDDGLTLELSNAQLKDAGTYSCRASNPAGFDEVDYQLQVFVPPLISKPTPDNVHVIEGQSVSMRCSVTGSPEPSVLWFKDGAVIVAEEDGHKQILDQGSTLQITDAHPVDVARYTCHAENQAGFAEKYFDLDVWEPARINGSGRHVDVPVILNQEVILTCPAEGVPTPTIIWNRKNSPIPAYGLPNIRIQENGRQLVIISAQLLDFGDYSCEARNEAGDDRLQFRVSIMVPPEIEDGPVETAQIVNSRALLQCETSGQPKPEVTWSKDGKPFPATGLRHRMLPAGSLEFMLVRLEDDGLYQCTANNAAGNVSRSIQLNVQIPAKIVSRGDKTVRAAMGQTVVLSCQIEGSPTPELYWLKYRQYVNSDERVQVMENGSLSISSLTRRDSGVYTCLAQNNAGTDSMDIRLRVQEPPEIYPSQSSFTVLQNRTIVLPCQASGRPRPRIRWEKDGQEITTSSNYRHAFGGRVHYITLQTGGLAIPHTRAEDAGTYTCVAYNNAGETKQQVSLTVQVPPMIQSADRQYVVSVGERVELPCVTSGSPAPTVTWTRDRRRIDFRDAKYILQSDGTLVIQEIQADDTGNYVCTAENNVGKDSQSRLLRVQVPPTFVTRPRDQELTINSNFQLRCVARGIPTPTITWRLNEKPLAAPPSLNGVSTLTVRNAMKEDAGEYTCVATNPANEQQVAASARVIVKVPPRVLVPPSDWAVRIAEKVVLDCSVGGDPAPEILWTKNSRPVKLGDRIRQLSNGSLIIYDLTANDAGNYKCIAINDAGTSEAQSTVTVKSEPKFKIEPSDALVEIGDTVIFDCTAEGVPPPEMYWWKETEEILPGGRVAVLANNSLRIVAAQQDDVGIYRCFASNPLGKSFIETYLNVVVHGGYSAWGEWGPCTASCGRGEHTRRRTCDNPVPENGGRDCEGPRSETASCMVELCPMEGNWGAWSTWTACSLSCGGGIHFRRRQCDNPRPQNGGSFCPGPDTQQDYCNNEPCPVHGNWGPWAAWGDCSASCGGGLVKRFRTCSNPAPSGQGRPCVGSGEETDSCNNQGCPVDGKFGPWSEWSACSVTCGQGTRERLRECVEPEHGGRSCRGDHTELMDCELASCYALPRKAEGNLIGYVNNVDIADSTIVAEMIPTDSGGTRIQATVRNLPPEAANYLQHLLSLLTPVYWTTARELEGAYNGYTLTNGEFMREVQVEFATGEVLKMSHYANGVDRKGNLLFDIIIRGEVPDLGPINNVHLAPYQEEYIQTGPGTIYAHSSRLFSADGFTMPYAWNHTITYDHSLGRMPYLVQLLKARELTVEVLPGQESVRYILEADIAPGNPSNRCPSGFQHDVEGSFCLDNDECREDNPCSHGCHNWPGGFSCSCPVGFTLKSDAKSCQDLDECVAGIASCSPNQDCLNIPGSFRCVSKCTQGFERHPDGDICVDINECESRPDTCEHTCQNLVGSYRCSCHLGFRLGDNGRCIDENECERTNSPCSHLCTNTRGSYKCSCPPGYRLLNGRLCRDVNECYEGGHDCADGQECINQEGSFHCVQLCPQGFVRTESGRCQDVDECSTRQHRCYYNQRCVNTEGAYRCECPLGFTSRGPGQPCIDVNECRSRPSPCSYRCRNTWGSYECLCPPGQLQLADRKSCAGLEFLEPGRVLPVTGDVTATSGEEQDNSRTAIGSNVRGRGRGGSSAYYRAAPRGGGSQTSNFITKRQRPSALSGDRRGSSSSQALTLGRSPIPSGSKTVSHYSHDRTYAYRRPWRSLTPPRNTQRYGRLQARRGRRLRRMARNAIGPIPCPVGFARDANNSMKCADRDECAEGRAVCQHNCTNTMGSYKCSCPPGYRLNMDGYSCSDINECVEDRVDCGPERMCFNQRGSYSCIDIPCPPDYARDPTTNFCVLECVSPDIPCPPGAKYADIIEFRTVALPGGNPARQDLIRLTAFNQHDHFLPQTVFTILENDPKLEFLIRPEEGRGIVFTMEPLQDDSVYRITVRARSYDNYRRHIQYQTTFIIHISVSAFPY
ncbi:hemicentin-1 [Aplysia californica]|uniref:Hemicentin-1 n=1 Tax=Aplysia californica TaxID=6500 RepID=A0ABM1A8N0_APLCA|nr:hemicentin-1 [Aplysia californica]